MPRDSLSHEGDTTTTAEFPVKRWAKWIYWAVYAQTPRGRYERRVLTNPAVNEALQKAIDEAQREPAVWQSMGSGKMKTFSRKECPECGAAELPGMPNDCWDHPGVEFVWRRYALVPIDGDASSSAFRDTRNG